MKSLSKSAKIVLIKMAVLKNLGDFYKSKIFHIDFTESAGAFHRKPLPDLFGKF